MLDNPIVLLAGIGAISVICQMLAWKLKLPSILFLLIAGILLGPVLSWLDADQLFGNLLLPFISISVAIILFEGGLTLNLKEIKGYGSDVRNLITIGVMTTWILVTVTVHFIFDLNWNIAFLFGAITVVTGPTVIKPMLRVLRPKRDVANILQWEGILIDPIGAFLALLVFEFILASTLGQAVGQIIWILVKLIITGTLIGVISGYCYGLILRNYWIPEYLQDVTTLVFVVFVYMISEQIQHESGLLSATIMGIWLANMKNVWIDEIISFEESISILLISILFILLASRLNLDMIPILGWGVLLFLALAQFVIRPISVLLCTFGSKLSWQERALVSWISPRGIVAAAISSLFVIRLQNEGIEQSEFIVPLTFMLIIGTVVFQSITAKPIANFLNVSDPAPKGVLIIGAHSVGLQLGKVLNELDVHVVLVDSVWSNVNEARSLGLNAYHGNATSGHAEENLNLSGVGKLIAMSHSRERNALACVHFRGDFGMDSIFSLQQKNDESLDKHEPVSRLQTNALFAKGMSYSELDKRINQGEDIIATKIDEESSFKWYKHQYQKNSIFLFAIDSNEELHIFSEPKRFEPEIGWTVFRLGPG